jgi:hypothetical protein
VELGDGGAVRGIYLTDLVRLDEHPDNLPQPKIVTSSIPTPEITTNGIPNNNVPKGNPKTGGLINFSKRRKVYEVIANKLQQYQQLTYNFQPGAPRWEGTVTSRVRVASNNASCDGSSPPGAAAAAQLASRSRGGAVPDVA